MTDKPKKIVLSSIGIVLLTLIAMSCYRLISSREAAETRPSNLISYTVVDYVDDSPTKESYLLAVPFVENRLPSKNELIAIAEYLRSKSPATDRTNISFKLDDDDYELMLAEVDYLPELKFEQVSEPDPPSVRNQKRFGLSYLQRKRLWLEICYSEALYDEQYNALIDSAAPTFENPAFSENRERLISARQERDQMIYQRWGMTPDSDDIQAITAEAVRNNWSAGLTAHQSLYRAHELPGPSEHLANPEGHLTYDERLGAWMEKVLIEERSKGLPAEEFERLEIGNREEILAHNAENAEKRLETAKREMERLYQRLGVEDGEKAMQRIDVEAKLEGWVGVPATDDEFKKFMNQLNRVKSLSNTRETNPENPRHMEH